jgi:hypothetical protein
MGLIDILHMNRNLILGACALIAALALAALASAANGAARSPVTQEQYADTSEQIGGGKVDPTGPSGPTSTVGSLPFTGLDLALMGGAAVTLLAGGVLLRRRANPGEEA